MSCPCTVSVNPVACSGCRGCAEMFPEMFDWDEAADRPIPKPGPFEPEKVREAQALCPRQCIEAEPD